MNGDTDRAEFFRAQNSLAERGTWGLLYMNALGAVAILALFRGATNADPALRCHAVASLLLFASGMCIAAAEFFVMYHTSVAFQYDSARKRRWKVCSLMLQFLPIILFWAGAFVFAIGVL